MSELLKVEESGRWQDQPYEPQFEIEVGEEIDIGASTIVKDGKAVQISFALADIMVNAKRCTKSKRRARNPVKIDKSRAEKNPISIDKLNAESE